MEIVFSEPSPKQRLFLTDTHKHVAFGGARGGGKSWAVRVKAVLLALRWAGIVITIVRKSYTELTENHIKPLKAILKCGSKNAAAVYNDGRKELRFANGSYILFRYCDNDRDIERFQGTETHILFIDEATQFSQYQITTMVSSVRGADCFPKRIYYTCNPSGQGMGYIKRLFIDRIYEPNEHGEDYSFIQSLVTDNYALMRSNPDYIKQLEALPPRLREAWLNGRWDCFTGMFFEWFRATPDAVECEKAGITVEEALQDHRWTHVVEPFTPPSTWKIYRSYDWGYGKPFSVQWFALSPDDTAYMILELYGCTRTANEGIKWTNKQQADEIQKIESQHPWLIGKDIRGWADPSIWDGSHDTYGISCAEEMEKHGIWFDKGNNERIAGWQQVRERMLFDKDGYAKLYFFKNCKAIIRTMPLMIYDEHKVEDLDTDLEDHACDALRYFCMGRPIPPRIIEATNKPISDPLNQYETKGKYEKYDAIKGR